MAPGDVAIAVVAPTPVLALGLERTPDGRDELHVHAGGQGVWVARMARELGAATTLVCPLGGESGVALRALIAGEDIGLAATDAAGDTASTFDDRRDGEARCLWRSPIPALGRHDLDELYGLALGVGIDADVVVLTGTHGDESAVPDGLFERLAHDLDATGVAVVADLSGGQLDEVLRGGGALVKASEDDLRRDGVLADGEAADGGVLDLLVGRGAAGAVVSCAGAGAVAAIGEGRYRVAGPTLAVVEPRGAGDAMTAALAVGLARCLPPEELLRLAAAAGGATVTRRGLGSGRRETVEAIAARVEVAPL